MIKRITLALAAAAAIAGGAVAAPAAHASIAQPSCGGRTVKCLTATPPPVHYHAPPNLKYQAQPGNEWGDPPA